MSAERYVAIDRDMQRGMGETRAAVWYLDAGELHWFAFAPVSDAATIARRVLVMFRRPAVVMGYWWEPGERSLHDRVVKRPAFLGESIHVR